MNLFFFQMVRTYVRKSLRCTWNQENMKKAIDDVTSGNMGFLLASKTYGVPKTTLERRVKNRNKTAMGVVKKVGGIKCVFSEEQEEELLQYVLKMEEIF